MNRIELSQKVNGMRNRKEKERERRGESEREKEKRKRNYRQEFSDRERKKRERERKKEERERKKERRERTKNRANEKLKWRLAHQKRGKRSSHSISIQDYKTTDTRLWENLSLGEGESDKIRDR